MTIFLGSLLSFTRMQLGPIQKKQVEIDTKKKILGAVMDISSLSPEEVLELYNEKMNSIVIDVEGEEVLQDDGSKYVAEEVNIQKNYKISPDQRKYPVFMFSSDGDKVDYYIFPMFGNGLWDWISGFVALDENLNTVVGVAFYHKAETPGLGANIKQRFFMDDFIGESLLDADGNFRGVTVSKTNLDPKNEDKYDNEVDAIAGSTITGDGVTAMIRSDLSLYQEYFNNINSK